MCELGRSRRSNEEYDLLKKMSEEAFKKECLNSCEFKILGMFGVLQRQILFCGTRITAAAHEGSTPSVACSVDLGAGGFPFLEDYASPQVSMHFLPLCCVPSYHTLFTTDTPEERRCGGGGGGEGETAAKLPSDSHPPAPVHR